MNHHIPIMPGVFLTAVQTEKFKTGCFSLNFLRPMQRAQASKNALIPSVLLRGSVRYPDLRAISTRLDELYGASMGTLVRKKGEVQSVGFFADFIEDSFADAPVFAPMMAFVAEILLHPLTKAGAFVPEIVESEKQNLQNAIASRINDKRTYAVSEMVKTMCREEAYGIARLGELSDVAEITPENLYAQYLSLLETSRVEIFYMGRQSPQLVADVLKTALQALPRGTLCPIGTEVISAVGNVQNIRKKLDVTQGKLALGFRTGVTLPDASYPAMLMLNAIFGAGITSKLFVKVREELSLCYYASSSIDSFKGIMIVSSGIEFSKFDVAYAEILRQLEECKRGNISDYEFDSAKRYLCSDLRAAMDSPGRLDDYFLGLAVAGIDRPMQTLCELITRVGKQEVADAAKRVLLDTVFFLEGETQ